VTTNAVGIPRTLIALAVGVLCFLLLSLLRIRVQFAAAPQPAVGLILTLLMYFLPGFVTGLLIPRASVIPGVVLGLLTVGVVWFEVPLRPSLSSWSDLATALVAFSALGIVTCGAGCAAAGYLRHRRMTSNQRLERP
jgi:hypothetical protein